MKYIWNSYCNAIVGESEEWSSRRQRGRTWNPEIKSSSPALTTSLIDRGSPWFNSSAVLGHSQLVCRLPVGTLNLLSSFQLFVSLALKSPSDEWSIKYVCIAIILQFKQLEGRSLKILRENLLRWSLFTFIYNRSTIWILYIFHIISLHGRLWNVVKCVAPHLSYPVPRKSRVRIPLKPWYFSGVFRPIAYSATNLTVATRESFWLNFDVFLTTFC